MSEKLMREDEIITQLVQQKQVSVADLSRELGVSEVTIRSDLRDLEYRGILARTRGGAQPSSYQTILERQRVRVAEKVRIGQLAASLVHDSDTLMVEGGTTTMMLAGALKGKQGVQIVTNSILVIPAARLNPEFRLVLSGGLFHHESQSLVGAEAIETIRRFNSRLAFVGTDGFTIDRGLTTTFVEGAEVIKAMHQRSEQTWLLADSDKFGKAGFVEVIPIAELTGIVTDSGIRKESITLLKSQGVQLMIA